MHAEDELGLPTRGDACDPYPCANARTNTNALVDVFSASCKTPSPQCTTGDYVSQQQISWRGERKDGDPAATGTTQFAHCNCAVTGSVDARVQGCKLSSSLTPFCTIANHNSYPAPDGTAHDGSNWVSESTQTIRATNAWATTQGAAPSSATTWSVQSTPTTRRPLAVGPPCGASTGIRICCCRRALRTSPVSRTHRRLDGLRRSGLAYTRQFGSTLLDSEPLLPADAQIATKPDAKRGDAANHYFVQDPGIVSSRLLGPLPGPLACPPGPGCGHVFTSITEAPCLTCLQKDFPTWLFTDGNVVVQMSQGLNADATLKLDPGLVAMLTDPSRTLVPVSEPVSFLRARGNPLRAFALTARRWLSTVMLRQVTRACTRYRPAS